MWFQNAPEVPPGLSAGAAAVAAALVGGGALAGGAGASEPVDDDIEDSDEEGGDGDGGGGMDMPVLSFSMEHGVQEVPGGAQPVEEEWSEL